MIGIFLLASSFHAVKADNVIHLAVCSNLSETIQEASKKFLSKHPNIKIDIVVGSSGKLSLQIEHGARYQIFLSADTFHPNYLYKKGLASTKPVVYTRGALALFSRKARDLRGGLQILKDKSITRIAIANSKTAPYGVASLQALKSSQLFETLKPKFVYADSIIKTLSYSMIATDAGLVALSSLSSTSMSQYKEYENWIEVDPSLYSYTIQSMCILEKGARSKEVKEFYDFILSRDAQEIFLKNGYKPIIGKKGSSYD